jgi:nucleotide-binding universal stress UspA family protein
VGKYSFYSSVQGPGNKVTKLSGLSLKYDVKSWSPVKLMKRILLPVNPDYYTKATLKLAINLAKLYQSEIIPIHVIGREAEFTSIRDIALSIAEDHIKKVQSKIRKEGLMTAEPVIDYGNHVDRITLNALKLDVNVILFGIKATPEQKDGSLNLTIEKVIRHSDKPVWVLKRGHGGKIKKILCPVDFSTASSRALSNAIHLSMTFNAVLTILSVYTPLVTRFPWLMDDCTKENKASFSEYRDHFRAFLNGFTFPGSAPAKELRTGIPEQEILKEIGERKHDLVIMGSSGRTALGRMILGSVTEKVIRQVPCSFITTKSEDMIDIHLEKKINTIESHYSIARQKQKSGLLDEAIGDYLICLSVNDMHVGSLLGLSEIYGLQGMKDKEKSYRQMALEIINRLFEDKIDKE